VHGIRTPDPRFKAFFTNSPQGVGRHGNVESSWDVIAAPVAIASGLGDTTGGEQAADRRDVFNHLGAPDKVPTVDRHAPGNPRNVRSG
jgi:hypothetical protein